jgi:hypothetical protein
MVNDHLDAPQVQHDATPSPAACDFEASGGLNGEHQITNQAVQNSAPITLCDLLKKVISQSNPSHSSPSSFYF